MSTMAMATEPSDKRKPAALAYFLGFVFVFFIGVLICCYLITKRANPVFLDEHGRPAASSPAQSHAGH